MARLFAISNQSPFSRLKRDALESEAAINEWASSIAERMTWEDMCHMVVRDTSSGDVVAAAYWTVPLPDAIPFEEYLQRTEASPEPDMEEEEEEEEAIHKVIFDHLPLTSNRELIMECHKGLDKLRDRILDVWSTFRLVELATHPEHRRRGLASRLIRKMVDMAEKRGMLAYLETEDKYLWRGLYESLGFEERGRETIEDLSKFASKEERERVGAGNQHTHVVFVRKPKRHWTEQGY